MAKEKRSGSDKLKNAKHELFAFLYCGHHNAELFGNGTQCYAVAYGYKQKVIANLEAMEALEQKREAGYTVKVNALIAANKRMMNLCSVEGSALLGIPRILDRINFLMDTLVSNDFADRELTYVIGQRKDLSSKVQAIREFNRVRDRVKPGHLEGELVLRWADPEDDKE